MINKYKAQTDKTNKLFKLKNQHSLQRDVTFRDVTFTFSHGHCMKSYRNRPMIFYIAVCLYILALYMQLF